ncbi:MAG: hypothetical protein ACHQRM_00615 [Bacteroidia bacterium]
MASFFKKAVGLFVEFDESSYTPADKTVHSDSTQKPVEFSSPAKLI